MNNSRFGDELPSGAVLLAFWGAILCGGVAWAQAPPGRGDFGATSTNDITLTVALHAEPGLVLPPEGWTNAPVSAQVLQYGDATVEGLFSRRSVRISKDKSGVLVITIPAAYLKPPAVTRPAPVAGPAPGPTVLVVLISANQKFPWKGEIDQPIAPDTVGNLKLPLELDVSPIVSAQVKCRFLYQGTGSPAAGVHFIASAATAEDPYAVPIQGTSDARGEAAITVRDDRTTVIDSDRPGSKGAFQTVTIKPGTAQKLGVIEITVPVTQLAGDIAVQDGAATTKPYHGFGSSLPVVQAQQGKATKGWLEVHGSQFFAYDLGPGDWQIVLPADDPGWNRLTIVSGGIIHIDKNSTKPVAPQLVLAPASRYVLQIGVKDQVTGSAVKGADISIRLDGTPIAGRLDADGKFVVDNLRPGKYLVSVTAPNFRPAETTIDFTKSQSVDVPLSAYPTIAVSVKDEGGKPVANARMIANSFVGSDADVNATSNADGVASMVWPSDGPVGIVVMQGQNPGGGSPIAGSVRLEKAPADPVAIVVHPLVSASANVQIPAQVQGRVQLLFLDPDTKLPVAMVASVVTGDTNVQFKVNTSVKRAQAYVMSGGKLYKAGDVEFTAGGDNVVKISLTADDLKQPLTLQEALGATAAKGK
jgi:hypothetical protein